MTSLNQSHQEGAHRWPRFLPDGVHFLFTVRAGVADWRGTYVGSFDGKPPKRVPGIGVDSTLFDSGVIYASPNRLLAVEGDSLVAHSFDPNRLELTRQALTVVEGVGRSTAGEGPSPCRRRLRLLRTRLRSYIAAS